MRTILCMRYSELLLFIFIMFTHVPKILGHIYPAQARSSRANGPSIGNGGGGGGEGEDEHFQQNQ